MPRHKTAPTLLAIALVAYLVAATHAGPSEDLCAYLSTSGDECDKGECPNSSYSYPATCTEDKIHITDSSGYCTEYCTDYYADLDDIYGDTKKSVAGVVIGSVIASIFVCCCLPAIIVGVVCCISRSNKRKNAEAIYVGGAMPVPNPTYGQPVSKAGEGYAYANGVDAPTPYSGPPACDYAPAPTPYTGAPASEYGPPPTPYTGPPAQQALPPAPGPP